MYVQGNTTDTKIATLVEQYLCKLVSLTTEKEREGVVGGSVALGLSIRGWGTREVLLVREYLCEVGERMRRGAASGVCVWRWQEWRACLGSARKSHPGPGTAEGRSCPTPQAAAAAAASIRPSIHTHTTPHHTTHHSRHQNTLQQQQQ